MRTGERRSAMYGRRRMALALIVPAVFVVAAVGRATPSVDRDGQIAFVRSDDRVWVVNPDGSGLRRLAVETGSLASLSRQPGLLLPGRRTGSGSRSSAPIRQISSHGTTTTCSSGGPTAVPCRLPARFPKTWEARPRGHLNGGPARLSISERMSTRLRLRREIGESGAGTSSRPKAWANSGGRTRPGHRTEA